MSITKNTTDLRALLAKANALPDADCGGNDFETKFLSDTLFEYENNQITSLRDMCFYGLENLRSVSMPELLDVGAYAFGGCLLDSVNFLKVHTVGDYAFYSCANLVSVNLPSAKTIGANAFRGCTNLESVYFQELQAVEAYVFYGCGKLTRAEFCKDVEYIGNSAFTNCSSLSTLILRSSFVSALNGTTAFNGTPIFSGTGYVYVPRTLVDSYKAAPYWAGFAARIRVIEDYPDITGG